MFTQIQMNLTNALLSAVLAQLLLTAAGRSAALTNDLHTTATTAVSSEPTQLNSSSVEAPRVLLLHKPCGSEHENYCENGGQCMYPQDSDKPSCICPPSYEGSRCFFFTETTHTEPELEKQIGISFAVVMLLMVLVIIIYCFAHQRCRKSTPLIKSAPSETLV